MSYRKSIHQQVVLIVDDMPINIQVIADALCKDYRIKVATSGEKALDIARQHPVPDLILLDIMMPGMDGFEVCRELKQQSQTKDIPVIFITSRDEVEDETAGFRVGAVDYITKPVQIPVLKARVRTHLMLKRKTDLLESLASLDGLTDIPNRRRLDEGLEQEWRRAVRSGQWLSLLMIDVDEFKKYNDLYGHTQGDECLRRVAQALASVGVRSSDIVARYGGEEFALLLPETDEAGLQKLGEDCCKRVAALNIPHEASSAADVVTVSVGGAAVQADSEHLWSDLVEAADNMLYEAKRQGRNRAVFTAIEKTA